MHRNQTTRDRICGVVDQVGRGTGQQPGTDQRSLPRRSLLLLGAAAASTALTGCSIRLEQDAPPIPGIPTQGPVADQALLLSTLSGLRQLVQVAQRAGQIRWAPRLATLHRAQLTHLTQIIAALGIAVPSEPAATPPAVSSPTGTSTAGSRTSTAALAATSATLAGVELAGLSASAIGAVARGDDTNLPMLGALLATRGAAAAVLGRPTAWTGDGGPSAPVAVALLNAVRPAVYGLEVVAAKTPLKDRATVRATLTPLYGARAQLEAVAGSQAPADQLSYALPVQVTDAASGRRLAQQLLGRVVTTAASQVPATHHQPGELTALLRLWSGATAESWRWGVTPTPFPGLRAP